MGLKILIVDDESDSRRLLSVVARIHRYEPVEAGDGPTALALAPTLRPAVILLDVMMPGMDGFEVCRRLKADPATAATPVAMVSAKSLPSELAHAFAAGAQAFFPKPFNIHELVGFIKQWAPRPEAA